MLKKLIFFGNKFNNQSAVWQRSPDFPKVLSANFE